MHALRKRKSCANVYISACSSHAEYASLPTTYGSIPAPLPSPTILQTFSHTDRPRLLLTMEMLRYSTLDHHD